MKIIRKDLNGATPIEKMRPRDTFRWCGEIYMVLAGGERTDDKTVHVVCMTVPRPFTGDLDYGTYVVPVDTELIVTEKE